MNHDIPESMYEISLLTVMAFSVIFALSLNLITGFCGQISLGHAAFYGIGAYTAALFTTGGGSFWLALPLVEQSTRRAFEIADTVCVLESGRMVWSGAAEAAREDPALVEAYLGLAR